MFNMFLVNRLSRALRLSPPSMTPQQPDETLQPKLHPKASSAGHGDQKPRLLLLGEKGLVTSYMLFTKSLKPNVFPYFVLTYYTFL